MRASKSAIQFDPANDIPSLKGKVILVTGGNSGLGKQSVLEFCRHEPAQIWLAARDLKKAEIAAEDIKSQVPNAPEIQLLELNLGSFASINAAAQKFSRGSAGQLHILMLNAGIMASAPALTKEGYEVQFGVNHMGHALLTKLLLPSLERATATDADGIHADVRVVVLSSAGHSARPPGGIDFDLLKTIAEKITTYHRYGQSKLANILFARELAARYPYLKVAAVHPGAVQTGLPRSMTGVPSLIRWVDRMASRWYKSVDEGVKNQLWASVAKDYPSGAYFEPIGVEGKAVAEGKDDELAGKLWEWTEKELQAHGF